MNYALKSVLIAMVAMNMTGCLSILPEPASAPTIYRLKPAGNSVVKRDGAKILRVDVPSVPASLRGPDIAVSPDGRIIAYTDGAKWDAPIPSLIQRAVIEGFDQSETLRAVSANTGVESDYLLSISVRSYEAVFINGKKTAPQARVVLDVALVKAGGRQLVGSKLIRTDDMASEYRVERIVVAQENATREAINEIVQWAEAQVNRPGT